jgi:hypothetical protein
MTSLLEKLLPWLAQLAYQNDFEAYLQAQRFTSNAGVERAAFQYLYERQTGL